MTHEHDMRLALLKAEQALVEHEVPVGAVTVQGERVIGVAHNQREMLGDPTAHAEMIAITQAASFVGDGRPEGCTLNTCIMCCGAILQARIPTVGDRSQSGGSRHAVSRPDGRVAEPPLPSRAGRPGRAQRRDAASVFSGTTRS